MSDESYLFVVCVLELQHPGGEEVLLEQAGQYSIKHNVVCLHMWHMGKELRDMLMQHHT